MNEHYNSPGKDGTPGQLGQFLESQFPRILFPSLAEDAEIVPGSVQEWRYEKRSYIVIRNYHLKTKELQAEFRVAVHSSEGESTGRKWFVNMRDTGMLQDTLKLTPLGHGVKHLRIDAQDWLYKWIGKLNEGEAFAEAELVAKDKTSWKDTSVRDIEPTKLREVVYRMLPRTDKNRLQQIQLFFRPDFDFGKWEMNSGRVRIHHYLRMGIPMEPGGPTAVLVDLAVVLETQRDVDPASIAEAAPSPGWTLVSLRVVQGVAIPTRGP